MPLKLPMLTPRQLCAPLISAGLLAGGLAQAQSAPADAASTAPGWQACQIMKADANRPTRARADHGPLQHRHRPACRAGAAAAHAEYRVT
jgi:hypothetical protein